MPRPVLGALAALIVLVVWRPAFADDSEVLNFKNLAVFFQKAQQAYLGNQAKNPPYQEKHVGLGSGAIKRYAQEELWKRLVTPDEVAAAVKNGTEPWTAIAIDGDTQTGVGSVLDLAKGAFPTSYANLGGTAALQEFRKEMKGLSAAAAELRARFNEWGSSVSDWTIISRVKADFEADRFELPASLANADPRNLRTYIEKIDAVCALIHADTGIDIPDQRRWAVYKEALRQAKDRFPGGKVDSTDATEAIVMGQEADTLNPKVFAEKFMTPLMSGVLDLPKKEEEKKGDVGGGEVQ